MWVGLVLWASMASGATRTAATCGSADVATQVAASSTGDVVVIPAGTCTWTSRVAVTTAITLRGAGAGGYVGRSATLTTVGTGAKTFTTQSGLVVVVGETLTARYTNADGANYLTGTITSYSGTTLVLNVTSTGGSGTYRAWIFERPASTTIVNSAVDALGEGAVQITESTSGSITVQGVRFTTGTGTLGHHIWVAGQTGGSPVLIHGNWFSATGTLGGGVQFNVNRGVVYRNSFNGTLCSTDGVGGCTRRQNGGVYMENAALGASWASASTMGTADIDGTKNLYVEDNYLLAFWQGGAGAESGARVVFRHNTFHDSALAWHGADSELLGSRHWEIYDNAFVYTDNYKASGDDYAEPYNLNWFIQARGGTGVITGNTFDDINDNFYYWGNKSEVGFAIFNLRLNSGSHPCWGAGVAGAQYPSPRQVGFGYVGGAAGTDSHGFYIGDSEPIYLWSNTGTLAVQIFDFAPNECTSADATADYFVSGRDYFVDAGAKPGWTRYTYPHPLRAPAPPTDVR